VTLLFNVIASNAQGALDTDSLKNLLAAAKEDTTRIILLSKLCNELARFDPDSAIQLAQDGLKLAKQIHYFKGEVYLTWGLGVAWGNVGDYSTAIKLYLSNLEYVDTTNDRGLKGRYYAELTNFYRDLGDYSESLKYANKNIESAKEFLLPRDSCRFCRGLFLLKASVYLEMRQLDSARKYIHEAFSYPITNQKGIDAAIYTYAARIQAELKNYDTALQLYRQSIQGFLQLKHIYRGLASTYNYMAVLFDSMKLRDSALFYLHKSLAISQPKNFAKEILETDLLLSKLYERYDTDSALYYHKQAMITKDILYNQEKQRQLLNYKFNLEFQQQEAQNAQAQYRNRIKIYALLATAGVLLAIGLILLYYNDRRKKAYALLQKQKQETDIQKAKTEQTLEELKSTQAQLIQSEKMASLGELTAGIAHEIQNPLNFVNNFSEVNKELVDELQQELKTGKVDDAIAISNDIKENEEKILHHGKRADAIVKGMLQHSRVSTGQKEPTDINALADEYLRLSYHGMRAKDKSFNATLETHFETSIEKINVVPQDIGRVLLNLFNNAFYSVMQKKKEANGPYEPTVSVCTKKLDGKVEIHVKDNGVGIPQKVVDKIFQPFFTTKPAGQGTGLGLSLSYDIIKAHGGEIKVETKESEGAEFIIQLPII